MKIKHYIINDEYLQSVFTVSIGSMKEFKQLMKQKYNYDADELTHAAGYCVCAGRSGIHIWIPKFNYNNPVDIAILVHELLHAVYFRMVKECSIEDIESACYYIEMLTRKVLTEVVKDENARKSNKQNNGK